MSAKIKHQPSITTQILACLYWNGLHIAVILINLFLIYGTYQYPRIFGLYILLPYFTYTLFLRRDELNHGHPWRHFSSNFVPFRVLRAHLGLEFRRPLPPELVEAEKGTDAQFVFAFFPHGVAAEYRVLMDGMLHTVLPDVARKTRTLTATVLFRIPFVREVSLWTGCVDARRSVAEKVLDEGLSVVVVPGGEAEQIRTVRGREIVYLSKRKGFVKLALRKGIPLVPVYVFGCSDMFYTCNALFGVRHWLVKNLGICIMLTMGMGGPFCPLPVKNTIAFGRPLTFSVKEKGNPTDEELDVAHKEFCDALRRLFDEHKEQLGYGDRTLVII